MTTPPASAPAVAPPAPAGRGADLALARVHLRTGSLALARAELESLAGRDALDPDGLIDLVEARWRTGDLAGAGEAAALALDDDGDGPLIALIVAAEAAVLDGRPSEARRHADRALAAAGSTLDAIFAGMPRGPVWPADATDQPATTPTMFETPIAGSALLEATRPDGRDRQPPEASSAAAVAGDEAGVSRSAAEARGAIGLWDAALPPTDRAATGPVPAVPAAPGPRPDVPRPVSEGHGPAPSAPTAPASDALAARRRGEDALARGELADAAVLLSLALRLDPRTAAAVVATIETHADPRVALVRGDAYRLLGREAEARRAYADAARDLAPPEPADPPAPADPPDTNPPEGDPA